MMRKFSAALVALVVAACGGDGITNPSERDALLREPTVLALGVDSVTGASIETNKDDYSPGEVVHLVGRGWAPGETVNLHMTEEPNTHADVDTNVVADAAGGFSIHFYDVQEHDLGVQFTLTATGGTSGSVAVVQFTDGTIVNAEVEMRDATVCTTPIVSVASGTPVCAFADFDITGSGATNVQFRWRNPSGVIVHIDSRSTAFPNGATAGQDTSVYTPIDVGEWTVLLCQSVDVNPLPGGKPDCASSSGKDSVRFDVTTASVGTSTTVTANPASPTVYGQSVTFTAAISPAATGTVTFYEFTGAIDCATATSPLGSDNSSPFEYTTTSLSVGSHQIWACFDADAGWSDSKDDISHTVNQADAAVTLIDSPAGTSNVGDNVTFTATVTAVAPGAGTPTGTVKFYEFTNISQTCASPGAGNLLNTDTSSPWSFSTTALTVGSHTITACYLGDTNFNPDDASVTHSVSLLATVTELSSSANPSVTGQSVTFTATVKHNGAHIGANGSVSFRVGSTNCSDGTEFANDALDGSGQATGSRSFNASGGDQTIRACYSGTPTTYATSSTTLLQDVDKATTTLSLATSGTPSFFGISVTFTATIGVAAPGSGTPTGNVKFYDGGTCNADGTGTGTLLATVAISGTTAAHATSALNAGTHTINACYGGDAAGDFTNAADDVEQVVNKATTSLALTSNNNPSEFGENVTFKATVSVTNGAATLAGMTVNFAYGAATCDITDGSISGGTSLGSNTLNASNEATVSISTLAVAGSPYNIVACFGGTSNIVGSNNTLSQVVNPAVTQVSLVSNPDPSVFGAATGLKFTATVSVTPGMGAGVPTGSVTFYYGTACSGTTLGTGTVAVNGSGVAEITDVVSSLLTVPGPHDIKACFDNTDGNFTDSNGADTHGVTAATTSTSIAANPNTTQQYSDKITLTATVTPKSLNDQNLSGSVQFKLGGSNIGSAVTLDCSGANCTATTTYTITEQSGTTLNFSASFTSSNVNFGNSNTSTDASVGVTVEDAVVLNAAVTPSNITIGNGGTLTFSIREKNPETNAGTLAAAGDLTKIGTSNVVVTAQGILVPSNQITFTCIRSFGGTALQYTHIINYTCTFPAVTTADTYDVGIDITGNYYDGAGAALIQVTDPNAGFTTGGGWYWHNGIVGGEKVNFGFMAKATVNNKKTNFQGSLLVIRHKANGDIIKVKSNVFEGYSIGTKANNCTPATFSGKATYSLNGVSEGNYAFTGYGLDCGEPGTYDKFGLYHAYTPAAGGEIGTSTTAGGLAASAKTIGGGNVQVPQPSGGRQ